MRFSTTSAYLLLVALFMGCAAVDIEGPEARVLFDDGATFLQRGGPVLLNVAGLTMGGGEVLGANAFEVNLFAVMPTPLPFPFALTLNSTLPLDHEGLTMSCDEPWVKVLYPEVGREKCSVRNGCQYSFTVDFYPYIDSAVPLGVNNVTCSVSNVRNYIDSTGPITVEETFEVDVCGGATKLETFYEMYGYIEDYSGGISIPEYTVYARARYIAEYGDVMFFSKGSALQSGEMVSLGFRDGWMHQDHFDDLLTKQPGVDFPKGALQQWTWWVYKYDGTEQFMYMNDTVIGSRTVSEVLSLDDIMKVGAWAQSDGMLYSQLADIRVYDVSHTTEEVEDFVRDGTEPSGSIVVHFDATSDLCDPVNKADSNRWYYQGTDECDAGLNYECVF